ncbi:hypothetical protein [Paenibacillus protaetiae]|uniref:hypothetical protein n=1 Tax=Paenibacillus protaetiae TaxID=2509456 RepID=UPI0026BBE842
MRLIGTANHGYSPYAIEELRRLMGGGSFTQLAAGEVFLVETTLDKQQLAGLIAANPPIFLRHIQPVDEVLELEGNESDLASLTKAVQNLAGSLAGRKAAVHVRKSAKTSYPYSPADSRTIVDEILTAAGAEIVRQQPDNIIAIYAADSRMYIGVGTPEEMLSDWPGGAIRFQKEEGQISRAKFKLLEAERVFGLDLSAYRSALDIGAAPGAGLRCCWNGDFM